MMLDDENVHSFNNSEVDFPLSEYSPPENIKLSQTDNKVIKAINLPPSLNVTISPNEKPSFRLKVPSSVNLRGDYSQGIHKYSSKLTTEELKKGTKILSINDTYLKYLSSIPSLKRRNSSDLKRKISVNSYNPPIKGTYSTGVPAVDFDTVTYNSDKGVEKEVNRHRYINISQHSSAKQQYDLMTIYSDFSDGTYMYNGDEEGEI